jgi:prepilin-type N-terminal cleavage/methylation domain-containing protein
MQLLSQGIKIIYVVDKMTKLKSTQSGFTLMEMLLVMVIVSVIVVMGINYTTQKTEELRRDRAALQYQQILNAALAYYISTNASAWPTIAILKTNGYLPNLTLNNPWGNAYLTATVNNMFYVYSRVPSGTASLLSQANILAGRLPFAFATTSSPPATGSLCAAGSAACYVAAGVTIPGQNLNNARSINFANLYHHGACVPAPICPANMVQEVMAVPVSVAGVNDVGSSSIYAIHSFTAYAYGTYNGGGTNAPLSTPDLAGDNVANCDNTAALACTGGSSGGAIDPSTSYWRVCLKVITSKGDVSATNPTQWAQYATILAVTRCAPVGEPYGSDFSVWTQP